jgi:hypothetical protein
VQFLPPWQGASPAFFISEVGLHRSRLLAEWKNSTAAILISAEDSGRHLVVAFNQPGIEALRHGAARQQ